MENVKVPENKNLTPDGSFKTKDGRAFPEAVSLLPQGAGNAAVL